MGIVGYKVEYRMGHPCYMSIPEFHIASRVETVMPPVWGLYTAPQNGCPSEPEARSAAGVPLYRGPLLAPTRYVACDEESVLRAYPSLVQNHLLLHRPELCPDCHGRSDTYCWTCGHGSHD